MAQSSSSSSSSSTTTSTSSSNASSLSRQFSVRPTLQLKTPETLLVDSFDSRPTSTSISSSSSSTTTTPVGNNNNNNNNNGNSSSNNNYYTNQSLSRIGSTRTRASTVAKGSSSSNGYNSNHLTKTGSANDNILFDYNVFITSWQDKVRMRHYHKCEEYCRNNIQLLYNAEQKAEKFLEQIKLKKINNNNNNNNSSSSNSSSSSSSSNAKALLNRSEYNYREYRSKVHFSLGYLYKKYMQKYEEAKRQYELSISCDFDNPAAHFNLANLLVDEYENFVKAEEHFQHAISLEPSYILYRMTYAEFLWHNCNRYEDSAKQYEAIIMYSNIHQQHQQSSQLQSLQQQQQPQQQSQQQSTIIAAITSATTSTNTATSTTTTTTTTTTNNNNPPQRRLRATIHEVTPSKPPPQSKLQSQQTSSKENNETYNEAESIADVHFNYGLLLRDHLKRYEEAVQQFEWVLKLNENDPDAREELQQAKTLLASQPKPVDKTQKVETTAKDQEVSTDGKNKRKKLSGRHSSFRLSVHEIPFASLVAEEEKNAEHEEMVARCEKLSQELEEKKKELNALHSCIHQQNEVLSRLTDEHLKALAMYCSAGSKLIAKRSDNVWELLKVLKSVHDDLPSPEITGQAPQSENVTEVQEQKEI